MNPRAASPSTNGAASRQPGASPRETRRRIPSPERASQTSPGHRPGTTVHGQSHIRVPGNPVSGPGHGAAGNPPSGHGAAGNPVSGARGRGNPPSGRGVPGVAKPGVRETPITGQPGTGPPHIRAPGSRAPHVRQSGRPGNCTSSHLATAHRSTTPSALGVGGTVREVRGARVGAGCAEFVGCVGVGRACPRAMPRAGVERAVGPWGGWHGSRGARDTRGVRGDAPGSGAGRGVCPGGGDGNRAVRRDAPGRGDLTAERIAAGGGNHGVRRDSPEVRGVAPG